MKLVCGFCDRVIVNDLSTESDLENLSSETIICGECYKEYAHWVLFGKFEVEMLKNGGY